MLSQMLKKFHSKTTPLLSSLEFQRAGGKDLNYTLVLKVVHTDSDFFPSLNKIDVYTKYKP